LDGAPADLAMNPKLAVQHVFTSLDSITASKPSSEDHTAWHPNQRGYMQVTTLDMLHQLGQICNFNEKFLTTNMILI